MCGIVGYVGNRNADEVILSGLKKLEYRGYDSSGIAVLQNEAISISKKQGRIKVLEDYISDIDTSGTLAIGHTRWATHGKPSDSNAHPHANESKSISLVHNGIIENYMSLKKELLNNGYSFKSDTDSEVLAHYLDYKGKDTDFYSTLKNAVNILEGTYAFGILNSDDPDRIYCVRKDSPLVIGIGEDENFIASDVPAILEYTNKVCFLDNNHIAVITKNSVEIFDENNNPVKPEITEIDWSLDQATKAGFPHFMLKEIHEQPKVIKETIDSRLGHNDNFNFADTGLDLDTLSKIKSVYFVACGTAYNASLQGKVAFQKIAGIKAEVELSSEFRYSDPFIDENTLVIFVSQSGETLDTLAALWEAKKKNAITLAITNVIGSSIAREADHVIYTMAGPEIAVASTKAYTTQVAMFFMLSLYIGKTMSNISSDKYKELVSELRNIPDKMTTIFDMKDTINKLAEKIKDSKSGFFIGRTLDYYIAMEAALKVKEISYMYTEAFAAGELKHGTIALIEDQIPVIGVLTQPALYQKAISNIKEVKSRDAYVIALTQEGNTDIEEVSDEVIYIPKSHELLSGILAIVPLQLLAYYISSHKGLDIDKPRNLAKSVTVE